MNMPKIYDLIIVGSGPAGLAASIYASRYKLDHLIFGVQDGGQMNEIYEIENWPGTISISGKEFINNFLAHLENFGVKVNRESVVSIDKTRENNFEIVTSRGKYFSRSVIMAMGAEYRKMNIPGEKELIGKGVSYCATCDAPFFKNKTVAVAGGGNSAVMVALELIDYADKIYLISPNSLSADPLYIDRINANSKIEQLEGNEIIEIKGTDKVEKIILKKPYNDKTSLAAEGVFIEIGSDPGISLSRKLGVETDNSSYIKVREDMSTSISGLYAAGDITTGSNKFRQVLTAAAEGAIAASSVHKLLKLK